MAADPETSPATAGALAAGAETALAASPARVQSFMHGGRRYWVKREERLGLRLRLQKGDPRRAFAAERRALRHLAALGAPVPPIVAEGADYFVTPDSGPTLHNLMRDAGFDPAERIDAFAAAGRALAAFHALGVSHGRPSIRDICWDGAAARFLDVERYAGKRNTPAGHAQDLVMLVFTAFAEARGPAPEIAALTAAYRGADPADIWAGARRLCRRIGWLGPLTWPVRRLRDSREFHAIPLTLAAFREG